MSLLRLWRICQFLWLTRLRDVFLYCGLQPSLRLILINLASLSKQGTIIDRIDYNIQNVATTVEEGLKQLHKVLSSFLIFHFNPSLSLVLYCNFMSGTLGFAGRENTEARGNGEVCYSAHHHVLYHVGSANPKGHILVIFGHCYLWIVLTFTFWRSPEIFNTLRDDDMPCLAEDRVSFELPQHRLPFFFFFNVFLFFTQVLGERKSRVVLFIIWGGFGMYRPCWKIVQ